MPTTNHLICYLGRNTSGKSYRANLLVKDQNYVKVSMADALRELAWKSLGWRPKNEEEYNEFKNSYYQLYGWDCFSGREYLKNLGEGCKDLFGEDFWVKQWEKNISEVIYNIAVQDAIRNIKLANEIIKIKGNKFFENETIDIDNIEWVDWRLYIPNRLLLIDGAIYPYHRLEKKTEAKITTDDIHFPIEVESAHKLGATFIWCDYQKGEYNNDTHTSEALANSILTSGKYTDGDEIEYNELKTFF